jgi:hypothetical protein
MYIKIFPRWFIIKGLKFCYYMFNLIFFGSIMNGQPLRELQVKLRLIKVLSEFKTKILTNVKLNKICTNYYREYRQSGIKSSFDE